MSFGRFSTHHLAHQDLCLTVRVRLEVNLPIVRFAAKTMMSDCLHQSNYSHEALNYLIEYYVVCLLIGKTPL